MLRAVGGRPWETAQVEFHGMLLSRRALEALAPFDPNMIVFENCDVALRATALGLRQVMDPNFVVTYAAAAGQLCDVTPYREHWATDATDQATRYFARKHGAPDDGEVVKVQCAWNRRHYESIGVVTRPRFPAPLLRDLFDHPFAQTWPQLLAQLLRQSWTVAEVEAVKRCHEVGRQLANGRYRASGKPFVSHLIGTASILAAYGAAPILVESALVHTAYDDLGTADEAGAAARALRQRVGTSVDRILRAFSKRRHLTAKPPASEEEFARYPLDDARSLILCVANEIEDLLDGGRALTEKPGSVEALTPHACAILPRLGFFALLAAYESAIRLDTALVGKIPVSLHERRKGSYRLSGGRSAATLALPDAKWAEVADYLTRNGRETDLAAGPHEFQYLAPAMRGEVLAVDPWGDAASDAIIAIHKGRLADQSKSALAALMRETPVFANDVFVLFSRRGSTLDERDRVHLGPIVEALGNGKY
ncbi:MAG: HD domain-containing protein [Rhodospirillales bacterium]|nr:HD domain-containing protein [Rhodospirillales bacterium]